MDWRSLPSLSSLRAFAAVAEHMSFSKAGAAKARRLLREGRDRQSMRKPN